MNTQATIFLNEKFTNNSTKTNLVELARISQIKKHEKKKNTSKGERFFSSAIYSATPLPAKLLPLLIVLLLLSQ